MHKKTMKIALYGMCIALAFILSYIEAMIPISGLAPGMKLGLTNLVVLFALYYMNGKAAFVVNIVRIFLVAITFGNFMSFYFALAGGMLSFFVMILLKKSGWFHITAVSVAGSVSHNIGQITVAMVVLNTTSVWWYFGILSVSGVVAGLAVGLLTGNVLKKMPRMESQENL